MLPLSFEANQGQTNPRVKFLSRGNGYTLFLTHNEAVLVLRRTKGAQGIEFRQADLPGSSASYPKRETREVKLVKKSPQHETVVRMQLVGASPAAHASGLEKLPGKSNYFLGHDPKKWCTNVPTYAKVKYQGIYPGVDLVYYGSQRQLEYDFVVAPGADPAAIALEFHGAEKARVGPQGDLVLQVAGGGDLRLHKPIIYQEVNGARRAVPGGYILSHKGRVSFQLEAYDATKPLVVDPVLLYSTYLGGSSDDQGFGIAVDTSGNAYVTGSTTSTDFPTASPIQATLGGSSDAFVAKLNPTGSALLYSTYLGGSSNESGSGIAVDSTGNAYVTGSTTSTDFPTASPIQATLGGSSDAFVTKLNSAGSALLYSTYLGGSSNDSGRGIAADVPGNAYVTGSTSSANFPTVGPFQAAPRGATDAFVAKLNPAGSALLYSTYLGGSSDDNGSGIAVDTAGSAYVTGDTGSANFPTATPIQGTFGGGPADVFVTKFNPAGSALVYSTYLGGNRNDFGRSIAVDPAGNAYVTGRADSDGFAKTDPIQAACGGCGAAGPDAFVVKLNPAGSALIYSTYLGGVDRDNGSGIAADASGNAYVTGTAGVSFPITPGAFQTSFGGTGGIGDAFVAKISPNVAPGFTVTKASLAFGNQAIGTTSAPQAVLLGNAGTATLTVTSVAITGTNAAEFAQSNTCGSSVAGGANCTINVTFAPATTGSKTAEITITDNAAGSPHILNLTGTGVPPFPIVSLSPPSLDFGNQTVGTTSAARAVTLTNSGSATLTITNITITGTNSGDFAQSNNCPISPATLAVGAGCTISATFKATAIGNRTATITITDNTSGSPHTVPLSGNGTADFTISASPSTATVTAGQSTTYTLTITPIGGFTGTVSLGCFGAPLAASCVLPASVTLSGSTAATATATVTTTAHSLVAPGPGPQRVWPRIGLRAVWQWLLVLLALAILASLAARHVDQRRAYLGFGVAILLILLGAGCGGGGGGGGGGTPAGNYTLTFTGTSGGLTHNTTVTLTVK